MASETWGEKNQIRWIVLLIFFKPAYIPFNIIVQVDDIDNEKSKLKNPQNPGLQTSQQTSR